MQRAVCLGIFVPWALIYLATQNMVWALLAGIVGGTIAAGREYYVTKRSSKKSRARKEFTR